MTSAEASAKEPLERAWQSVETNWDDDAAHRHFIVFCASRGALAEAGRRYREVRDRDPARRERAALQLHGVLGAAFASLDLKHGTRAQLSRSRGYWLGVGVALVLAGSLLMRLLRWLAR